MDGSQDLKAVGWIQAMVGDGWESGSEGCGLDSGYGG